MIRERIELLLDRDSAFLELQPLIGWGSEFKVGGSTVQASVSSTVWSACSVAPTGALGSPPRNSGELPHVVAGIGPASLAGDSCLVHTDHDAHEAAHDLVTALTHDAAFVGLIRSRGHASEHLEMIRAELGDAAADRVDILVGLDLDGRAPQEIALLILAGVVAVGNGRGGGWANLTATYA